jgi:dihydrofolate reductase
MRIVTYGGAVSLDGFLAGADGSIDWLHHSKDVQQVMADYWKDVDAVLMGRKTYEVAVSMGGATREKPKKNKEGKRRKPTVQTFIFSRTLKVLDDANVELVAGEAAEFVRKLKRQPGKGICLMGGGELAQSLLAAGLVDEIGLNIHPILLGSGIPAFRDLEKRVKLGLMECRQMDGGCILAKYKVVHANLD